MAKTTVVELKGVHKYFKPGDKLIKVINGIDFKVESGEFVVLFGPSGCGKSTVLHMIGGLEPPTKGKILVRGEDWYTKSQDELAGFRRSKIGIVFQSFNLLNSMTVAENVALPLFAGGESFPRAKKRAVNLLQRYGVADLRHKVPSELSGGEQQRVAMSRALATNPWILIADEPTGNLDSKSALNVMNLLCALNRISKRTIFMVSHNPDFINFGTRVIYLKDGIVEKEEKIKNSLEPDPDQIKGTEIVKAIKKTYKKQQAAKKQASAMAKKTAGEIKELSIDRAGFSTRVAKALQNNQIEKVGDLVARSVAELSKMKGIGRKGAQKIVDQLSEWGIKK